MKNIISNFICLCLMAIMANCDDSFLDRNPYTSLASGTIWTSDANALMALNGVYSNARREWGLQGIAYHFTCWGPDGYNYFRNSTIERNTATSRDGNFLNAYTAFYLIIRSANDVISNLTDNPNITPDMGKRMIGEAKFFRGISYFYLWQLWGGVIILDKPVLPSETYLSRNTAEEVRDFVIKDFTDAVEALPVSYAAADYGRVTKGAAVAMLGKSYLYDKQWAKAAEQFGKLLSAPYDYDLHPEYWQLFDYKWENNKEFLFAVQMIDQTDLGSMYEEWYGSRATYQYAQSYCLASHLPFETSIRNDGTPVDLSTRPKRSDYENEHDYGVDLMAWYEETLKTTDKRLQGNLIMPTDTFIGLNSTVYKVYWPYADYANATPPALRIEFSGYACYIWRKFVNTGNDNKVRWNSPDDIPIIRFSDVLLMYAEAMNEQNGATSEVYAAVNRVRERAEVAGLPEGLSKEDMRRNIWLERYREFPGEGILFFDVRRWRTAHTTDPIFGLNHDVLDFRGERLFDRKFAERYYLWPIPEAERDLNDKLDQNPGWEQ
ncbi:MAG: RagB/SusD family nutrient uptake outer membrane protein [Tannerella sp.]|nr:RagB/SusD family nutrient uptake outer membrane protein [Tannerella sp.]